MPWQYPRRPGRDVAPRGVAELLPHNWALLVRRSEGSRGEWFELNQRELTHRLFGVSSELGWPPAVCFRCGTLNNRYDECYPCHLTAYAQSRSDRDEGI